MHETLTHIPILIYFLVGVVSLVMAIKILFSRKFLPFHEKAYGKPWDDVEKNLQYVIIALMRLSSLGFIIVAFLMISFPIYNHFMPNMILKYAIPLIALFFCAGLFIINFILHKKTNTATPWKNSLYAMIFLILSIILSYI